jgi:O-acetyl-ADP-ribose deacetylase (regulator of RNase III)
MRLHLVDIEPELVVCWEEAFAPFPEVEVACANILEVAQDTLVSPANSYGRMDGGIDRLYSAFFGPTLDARVSEAIARRPEGYLPIGTSLLIPTGHPRIPHLIVAPTMLEPEAVPASHAFRAFAAILRLAMQYSNRIQDIYCPGLATGIGRVAFPEAAQEMANAYRKWKATQIHGF